MKSLVLATIISIAITGSNGQEEVENTITHYGILEYQQKITYSDGSYRLRMVLHDQEREEKGFFNSNGVWTVQGNISWFNPDRTIKHSETFRADDKGFQVKSADEPQPTPGQFAGGAPPIRGCAVPSLCG